MSRTDLQDRIRTFLNNALKKISIKDFDSAIEKLKAAEVIDVNNPEILYNLGICYCKKELYNTAATYFKKVLNLSFTFVEVITIHKLLSYSLIMAGEINEAIIYIDKGLKISQNDTSIMSLKGYALEQEKKYNEAIDIYMQIIEMDNNNYNAYNSLAYIVAEKGEDLNKAMEFSKTALKGNPANPAYIDTIGYIHLKKGQTDLAKKYLKQALQKMPDSKEIKEHINQLLKIDQSV
jgi:tetratricopeptide (TPR) repeat protein